MEKLDYLAIEFLKILVSNGVTQFKKLDPNGFNPSPFTSKPMYEADASTENLWRAYRQIRNQLEELERSESSDSGR